MDEDPFTKFSAEDIGKKNRYIQQKYFKTLIAAESWLDEML